MATDRVFRTRVLSNSHLSRLRADVQSKQAALFGGADTKGKPRPAREVGGVASRNLAAAVLRRGATPVQGDACPWPLRRAFTVLAAKRGLHTANSMVGGVPDVRKGICVACSLARQRRGVLHKVRDERPS